VLGLVPVSGKATRQGGRQLSINDEAHEL
jgi:hypothetical protein